MKKTIEMILLEEGFKANGMGIFMLADCIREKLNDMNLRNKELYGKINVKYNKPCHCIERSIRYVIEHSNHKDKTINQVINEMVILINGGKYGE